MNNAAPATIDEMPVRLGRYRITCRIGSSAEATVYRAWDDELRRDVAIKVPSRDRLHLSSQVEEYLAHARHVSRLDHPGIVPIFDLGRTDDGNCYLVSKFMSKGSLAQRESRLTSAAAARPLEIAFQLADSLHFAHKSGVVHANVKPSNILFDDQDHPCLADFGPPPPIFDGQRETQALAEAAYQSPEQLRGERHRIDARTDIYSLGAILYELLAGEWPASRRSLPELVEHAMRDEPPFLSDVAPGVPLELARICHKAMARRIADRYTTIVDFADDLNACASLVGQRTTATESPPTPAGHASGVIAQTAARVIGGSLPAAPAEDADVHVVPKGLRSFDQEDADFFLKLVPGPRARDGLPESLRFWKSQIEQSDPERTFSVGLIYGPSGCGKSSLIKAGLLPRLDVRIVRVYLEATPQATESRILAQLRRRCPQLPHDLSLTDSIAELRRGKILAGDRKVLIVLDQFEQWLHAHRDDDRPELSQALRQCDGRRVQAVLMVRDDFWMSVTRFMHDLDVTLVEGHNSAAVDLFGLQHARRVLIAFGRAYGALPEGDTALAPRQNEFLDRAIAGLAHDGKVIPVQLALFAEMFKDKSWTQATLDEVGGTQGIGLAFLEETFSAPHAPPEHRRHQRAARAVLRLLLPERETDIKGQMHSRAQLLDVSGYGDRPQEFDELMHILDQELRLVTPADADGENEGGREGERTDPKSKIENPKSSPPGLRSYQLTHDFLVPSVRRWLIRRQQETRRGRAELLLEEKAATWTHHASRRYLPSLWQTMRIRLLTRARDWSDAQRDMMRRAVKHHAIRGAATASLVMLLAWCGFEAFRAVKAQALRDRLLYTSTEQVPDVLAEMAHYRWWVNRFLQSALVSAAPNSADEWRVRLALLPDDAAQVDPLVQRAFDVDDEAFAVIRQALTPYEPQLADGLWRTFEDPNAQRERRLRAAMLLADSSSTQPAGEKTRWEKGAADLAGLLHASIVANPARFKPLVAALAPVGNLLVAPLYERSHDVKLADSDRSIAANLVAEYATERHEILTGLFLDADSPARMATMLDKLQTHASLAIPLLEAELAKRPEELRPDWNDEPLTVDSRPAPEAIAIFDAAAGMVDERFAICQTLPLADFPALADGLRATGYRPTQFRPYLDHDVVRVAATFARDGRDWKVQHDLPEAEVQQQLSGQRMQTELLVDLAAYDNPKGERRYAAVWAERRSTDPEARAYLGQGIDRWNQIRSEAKNEGFGVVSIDFHAEPRESHSYSTVLWKGKETGTLELRGPRAFDNDLEETLAHRTVTSIDLAAAAYSTRAEARRGWDLAELARNEAISQTNPENLANWFDCGLRRFRAGQYAGAIRDFTYFIEHGGERQPERMRFNLCHEYRAYAAARLGRREQAARWLEEANQHWGHDEIDRFRSMMLELFSGDLRNQPEEFEKYAEQWSTTGWAHRCAAQIFAFAAGIARASDAARAAAYTDRAIDHWKQAIANGENNSIFYYLTDIFFDAILDDPRMIPLQIDAELNAIPAIKFARQGENERARQELLSRLQKGADLGEQRRIEFLVSACLGDVQKAQQRMEAAFADAQEHQQYWDWCGGYSVASHLLAEKDPERAQWCATRAFEILNRKAAIPFQGFFVPLYRRELLVHWLFAALRNDPRMQSLLKALDRQYSVVYSDESELETKVVEGFESAEHLARSRELAAAGFRPVSIDACLPAAAEVPLIASVWQRPVVSQRDRDEFARRQAAAGAALVRLGKPDPVWPLLKFDPQPRLRSWLVELLAPVGGDPQAFVQRLEKESDVTIRRALVLALGKAPFDKLSPGGREPLIERLADLYDSDRDPGIHSAAEWTLRKWGQTDRLKRRQRESTSTRGGWTSNSHGDDLVTIARPGDVWIGTPASEPERGDNERRHRRLIPRAFQIATKEVTMRQLEEFFKDKPHFQTDLNHTTSPEPDCPAGMVTWYTMSAYCRWLCQRKGIPEDEIGYPPLDQIRLGMLLKPYFLSRSGYRIPTDAEFEYACRAGTNTPWYHGDSLTLLPQYAWSRENAEGRSWPVATLLPNELGLFDMGGNIQELCLQYLPYPKLGDDLVRDDAYTTQRTPSAIARRNGSFAYPRRETRAGMRGSDTNALVNPLPHIGFRIARTLLPPELEEARALRRRAAELRDKGSTAAADKLAVEVKAAYERLFDDDPQNQDYPWELAEFLLEPLETDWHVLKPVETKSRNGTTLSLESDGSLLASGKAPPLETYELRFESTLPSITALRLEPLPDPSLPGDGPGRYDPPQGIKGNFHLTEFHLLAAPKSVPDQRDRVPLRRAIADYSQFPIANAIDGDTTTPWGIWLQEGLRHWAVFQPASPLANAEELTLHVIIECQDGRYPNAVLGRFRISATSQSQPGRHELWRIRLARSSLSGWARLAAAQALLGRPDEARAALTRAGNEPYGEYIDDLFLLALIHHELGLAQEARMWLERGLTRFDVKTNNNDLKLLAADCAVIAQKQEPPDPALLARMEKLLGKEWIRLDPSADTE